MFLGGAVFHHGCLAKEAAGLCQPPTSCLCSFLPFSCVHPSKGRHPPGGGYSGDEESPLRERGGLPCLRADGAGLCCCSYPLGASSLLPPVPWLREQQKAPPKRCLAVLVYLMPLYRSLRYLTVPKNPLPPSYIVFKVPIKSPCVMLVSPALSR